MNRENLKILSDYLLSNKLKAEFDMEVYTMYEDEEQTVCGSVGCAVGHGPYAGIKKLPSEEWYDYSCRVFIDWKTTLGDNKWDWCFNALWTAVDNTPQGAAKRINWLLERGLPNNWHEQMVGLEPLCYL